MESVHHQRILVAQVGKQILVRRYSRRAVQPDTLANVHKRDQVVELRRGRNIAVHFDRRMDQYRIGVIASDFKHRLQERVLVLAISKSISGYFARRMRLVAAYSKRYSNVAK